MPLYLKDKFHFIPMNFQPQFEFKEIYSQTALYQLVKCHYSNLFLLRIAKSIHFSRIPIQADV